MLASVDWSASPVGDPAGWSPALRGAADLVAQTRFPATLLWGPELVLIYNEAYVPIVAEKHPASLGRPAREVFPEAWEVIGPLLGGVMAGAPATWTEDAPVPIARHGRLTEAYFTFSYSPVRSDDGTVEGIIDIVTETTGAVLDRRRQALLGELRDALADVGDADEAADRALAVLRESP